MTVEKKNSTSVDVASGSNVFSQINDRVNREETANHGKSAFSLAGTSDTMTVAELWDGRTITLTGSPTGAYTLNLPAVQRGPIKFINATGVDVSVRIAAQPGPVPVIPSMGEGTLTSDGTNVSVDSVITKDLNRIIRMTQAEYDALASPDASTLYVIIG